MPFQVIFAVDVSGSFKQTGFDTMMEFMHELMDLYILGVNETQIGISKPRNPGHFDTIEGGTMFSAGNYWLFLWRFELEGGTVQYLTVLVRHLQQR